MLELLLTLALGATLTAFALPLTGSALDELRTASAARYVEGRIRLARMDAVRRSRAVALRFEPVDGEYVVTIYADGNGNGVRSGDIAQGLDILLAPGDRALDKFPGVRFELLPDIPDLDGASGGTRDGVRIGTSRILTLGPDGTSSSGTLYLRGRRAQYAVRIFGPTTRTRVLQYRRGDARWIAR